METMTEMQSAASGASYTDEQKSTIKTAAMGAIALVSLADPGLLSSLKESWAGSKALAKAPASLQQILREGGFPTPPQAQDAAGRQDALLAEISQAAQILRANPADLEAFQGLIGEAMDAVANASDGVDPAEQQMMDRIRAALSA